MNNKSIQKQFEELKIKHMVRKYTKTSHEYNWIMSHPRDLDTFIKVVKYAKQKGYKIKPLDFDYNNRLNIEASLYVNLFEPVKIRR